MDQTLFQQLVGDVRKVYNSGKTQSLTWRKEQLRALLRMFDEEKEAMVTVLGKDLRKVNSTSN